MATPWPILFAPATLTASLTWNLQSDGINDGALQQQGVGSRLSSQSKQLMRASASSPWIIAITSIRHDNQQIYRDNTGARNTPPHVLTLY
jgi:hypothetical protein